jgi:hypothetical protein
MMMMMMMMMIMMMMVLTERGTYYKLERIKNKPIKKKKIFWR